MTGERTGKTKSPDQAKTTGSQSQAPNTDFWFYLVDVELFRDDDRDGYFSGIDLLFDADTIYTAADVYALVYLSLEGGPWNEYAATEDFTIFGATSSDDYVIVTELLSGYPTGSYDILIELFDAFDSSLLAFIGPADTSELGFLPLEDIDRDTPFNDGHTIIVYDGGGGSLNWLVLLLLVTISVARRRSYAPAGMRLPPRAVRMTFLPQAARLSKYTYSAGTTSSDTTVEKARPPIIARAIG